MVEPIINLLIYLFVSLISFIHSMNEINGSSKVWSNPGFLQKCMIQKYDWQGKILPIIIIIAIKFKLYKS